MPPVDRRERDAFRLDPVERAREPVARRAVLGRETDGRALRGVEPEWWERERRGALMREELIGGYISKREGGMGEK